MMKTKRKEKKMKLDKELSQMSQLELIQLNGDFYPTFDGMKVLIKIEKVESKVKEIILVDKNNKEMKEMKSIGTIIAIGEASCPFKIGDVVEFGEHAGYNPEGDPPDGYELKIIRDCDVNQVMCSSPEDYLKRINPQVNSTPKEGK